MTDLDIWDHSKEGKIHFIAEQAGYSKVIFATAVHIYEYITDEYIAEEQSKKHTPRLVYVHL